VRVRAGHLVVVAEARAAGVAARAAGVADRAVVVWI
jgi:hypothetical protein